MTGTVPTPLAPLVQRFFTERLAGQLGASANTIESCRDSFRLLLGFAEARCGKAATDMDVTDIDIDLVADFLGKPRDRTRQQRAEPQCPSCRDPVFFQPCRRQRAPGPAPLPEDPAAADETSQENHSDLAHGGRDQGARRRARPRHLARAARPGTSGSCGADRPSGVGADRPQDPGRRARNRRPRAMPRQGPQGPRDASAGRHREGPRSLDRRTGPLRCSPATGAARSAATRSSAWSPSIDVPPRRPAPRSGKRRSPRTAFATARQWRCCTRASDATVIALWLGHESAETTQVYLHADLRLKEKAMERTRPVNVKSGRFKPDDTLPAFLKSL